MIRIANETELREFFRPLDRDEVILPDTVHFPVDVKDYFSWIEPSGSRVYLLFQSGKGRGAPTLGVVFRRDQSAGGAPNLCEFCHSVRGGQSVGMLTAAASGKRRVGINACRDLSCKKKAEEAPSPNDLPDRFPDALSERERVWKILERMTEFSRKNLF